MSSIANNKNIIIWNKIMSNLNFTLPVWYIRLILSEFKRIKENPDLFLLSIRTRNILRVQTHFILTCKRRIISECKHFLLQKGIFDNRKDYLDTVSKSLMFYSYSFNVELVYSV